MSIFSQFDHNMYADNGNLSQHDDGSYIHDGIGHYNAHLAPWGADMTSFNEAGGYPDHGNAHCILCEVDPLAHAHNYHAHPLIFGEDGRPLVHVDGYMRSDGTYVGEHYRTLPDGNPYNNLSSKY